MLVYRITTDKGGKYITCDNYTKTCVHTGEMLKLVREWKPDHDGKHTKIVDYSSADVYTSLEAAIIKAKELRGLEVGQYKTVFRIHIQDLDVSATEKAKAFCYDKKLTKSYSEYNDTTNYYSLFSECQSKGWDFFEVIDNMKKACYGVGDVEVLIISKAEKLLSQMSKENKQ